MKVSDIKIGLILLLHPGYKLISGSFCDISSLEGCTIKKIRTVSSSNKEHCLSNNGKKTYKIPLYAKIASDKDIKYIRYHTETYKEADDIYQLVLSRNRIPMDNEKRK